MRDSRQVVLLNLDDILPNRFQPRIKFDEKAIVELSESIKEHGVIQPIIVRKISDKFEIIAGERRYKASVMAGKSSIPAIIVDLNDKDSSEIALIENVQRQDLTPIEEAISYRKILDMGYLTQEALATKLGVAQSTIANKLRLLNLDDEVQEALLDGKISERHARSLLKLSKSSMQREMLKRIIDERLTVRKTDEEINNMMKNNETSVLDSIQSNDITSFENTSTSEFNKNDNPFIINNDVTTPVVNHNVEVLDFGFDEINPDQGAQVLNNEIDTIEEQVNMQNNPVIEEQINMPNNPIIVDVEPLQNYDNNVEAINNSSEQNNYDNQPINNFNEVLDENSLQSQIDDQTNITTEQKPQGRFFTMVAPSYEDDNTEQVESNINIADSNASDFSEVNTNIFNNQINDTMNYSNQIIDQPTYGNEISNPNIFNNQINDTINYSNEAMNSPAYENEVPNPNIFNTNAMYEQPVYEQSSQIDNDEQIYQNIQPLDNVNIDNEQPVISVPNNIVTALPSLRDIINKIRKCADEIEAVGFDIDTEEYDFDDIYQVIFKIKK